MISESGRPSKLRALSAAKGPRDKWGVEQDQTAAAGNSMDFRFCRKLEVGYMAMDCRPQGIRLAFASQPSPAVLPDYPSVLEDRVVAASELGRIAPLAEIHFFRADRARPTFAFVRLTSS